MVELARLPLKLSTAKEMECYVQVGIAVLQRREPLPDGNLDSKLLLQLPPQRLLEGLPLLDLTAWKLPMSGHIAAPGPLAEQAGAIPNERPGHDLRMGAAAW